MPTSSRPCTVAPRTYNNNNNTTNISPRTAVWRITRQPWVGRDKIETERARDVLLLHCRCYRGTRLTLSLSTCAYVYNKIQKRASRLMKYCQRDGWTTTGRRNSIMVFSRVEPTPARWWLGGGNKIIYIHAYYCYYYTFMYRMCVQAVVEYIIK